MQRLSRRSAIGAVALVAASTLVRAQDRDRAAEGPPLAATPDEKRVLEALVDVYRNHRYLSVSEEDGRRRRHAEETMNARDRHAIIPPASLWGGM